MTTRRVSSRVAVLAAAGLVLAGVALGEAGHASQSNAQALPTPPSTAAENGGPLVVRRLTESQYRATIADIFGSEIPVLGRFERGLRHDDLQSVGTSRAGISSFSLEQYDVSAQGIAATVFSEQNRHKYISCKPSSDTAFDASCAQNFIDKYGRALFRRPLTKEQSALYLKTAKTAYERGGFYKGLQFTLAGMLVAPDFLLRIEQAKPLRGARGVMELDAYSKATRLSYFLINSTPDDELLRAAEVGELDSGAGLARQAERLIASPEHERAIRAFFQDMLHLDSIAELAKDPEIFPAFNAQVALDAQEQTLRTIVDHLIAKKRDYRDLFTTRDTFLTRSLGVVYRIPVGARNDFERAQYPSDSGRAGILANLSFLALYSHPGTSSPTLRGRFIRQNLLCQPVPDPPPNVDFSKFEGPEAVLPTARMRLDDHNESPACAGCHKLTDPIGLALENFDGLGSFRTRENDTLIDVRGSLDGVDIDSAVSLGKALRESPEALSCLVQKLYQTAAGHSVAPSDSYQEFLGNAFQQRGYRVPELMRTIATSPAFYTVSSPGGGAAAPARTAAKSTNGGQS